MSTLCPNVISQLTSIYTVTTRVMFYGNFAVKLSVMLIAAKCLVETFWL